VGKTSLINKLLVKEAFFCMLFSFLVMGLVLLVGLNVGFFSPFKNAFKDFSYLDLYYAEKLNEDNFDFNEDIILVNIDRLNRKEIAEVLGEIEYYNPKVIGLDVIFKETEDPIWDSYLNENLQYEPLVFAYTLQDTLEVTTTKEIFNTVKNKGYTNFNFDNESSVIRNFQGVKNTSQGTLISFPVAIASAYLKNDWLNKHQTFLEKERPIKFSGTRNSFLVLEREDVIESGDLSFIKDKIVMVGYLGNIKNHYYDIEDKHYTPMNPKFVGKSPPDTFGLIVHANIVQMLLTNDYVIIVQSWVRFVLMIFCMFFVLMYFIYLNKKQLASYILRLNLVQLSFLVLFVWISLLFFKNGILLKVTPVTATVVFSMGLIGYYKKLAHYLYKRYKWEGYFYHD
jgi:CHASE2 domain-containing sensor protein